MPKKNKKATKKRRSTKPQQPATPVSTKTETTKKNLSAQNFGSILWWFISLSMLFVGATIGAFLNQNGISGILITLVSGIAICVGGALVFANGLFRAGKWFADTGK